MKRIVPILIIVLVVISSVSAFADECYILCNPSDYINIRMTPSSNGVVVGRFDCGDSFETDWKTRKDKKGKTWVHVINMHLESTDAWVCKNFVQETPVVIGTDYITVDKNGRTAVRKYPNGKVRKWVENGDELRMLARSDEWAFTTYGYIRLDCVEGYHE